MSQIFALALRTDRAQKLIRVRALGQPGKLHVSGSAHHLGNTVDHIDMILAWKQCLSAQHLTQNAPN